MNYTDFFIYDGDQKLGPFDSIAMIKRIRNQKLSKETMVSVDGDEPKEAYSIEMLAEYFDEPHALQADDEPHVMEKINPFEFLKEGLKELADNQDMIFVAGLGTLVIALVSIALSKISPVVGSLVSGLLFGAGIFIFMAFALQKVRGREVSSEGIRAMFAEHGSLIIMPIMLISLILLAIPAAISALIWPFGLLVLAVGFIFFCFFLFAPFYWMDGASAGGKCFKDSWRWMASQHIDVIGGLIFAMFVNFVAAAFMVVPLFIVFPATALAFADLYERFGVQRGPTEPIELRH